jgi:hypothetical protein
MAERLAKLSEIGEYKPYHFIASQADTIIDVAHTHGTFLGYVVVGTVGTTPVIKLGNGTTATAGNIISIITPTVAGTYAFQCTCDTGLYVFISGSGMDVTIMASGMAI